MAEGHIIYRGNCNCGRYRYELTQSEPIDTALACTCSLCVKKGHLWLDVPKECLKIVRDDGCLAEYTSQALRDQVRI